MKEYIQKYLFGKKFYKVKARYKKETVCEFFKKLTDSDTDGALRGDTIFRSMVTHRSTFGATPDLSDRTSLRLRRPPHFAQWSLIASFSALRLISAIGHHFGFGTRLISLNGHS